MATACGIHSGNRNIVRLGGKSWMDCNGTVTAETKHAFISQPKRFFQDLAYDGLDRAHAKPSALDDVSPSVPLSGWNTDSTDKLLGEIVENNHNNNNAEQQQEEEQNQANICLPNLSNLQFKQRSYLICFETPRLR
jgi:hypothetical protein